VVDLTTGTLVLAEPEEFGRFSVEVVGPGGADTLSTVLDASGLGRLHAVGEQVVVDPMELRAMAAGVTRDVAAWDEGFGAMCAYAAEKGWMEPDGGILAHIVWNSED